LPEVASSLIHSQKRLARLTFLQQLPKYRTIVTRTWEINSWRNARG